MTHPRRTHRALRTVASAAAASSLVLLAGCGTSQPTAQDEPKATSETAAPITLTDAAGRTVELPAPAEKVVVLEWQMVEDVLALGVDPVGVADVKGYNTWDTAEDLDPATQDVGMRGEPNLDALYATDPDLVITEVYGPDDAVVKQLEKYDVPVLATLGADAKDPIGQMKDTFTLVAQALGKEDEAERVLTEFDQSLSEGREAIEAAAPEVTDFAYVDAWVQGSTVAIRPFGQGSFVGEIGEELGLTNAWKGKVDPAYGLGSTDVEGIAEVGEARLFHTSTDADTWLPRLEDNAVWTNAPFVKRDLLAPFPAGIWTFGGPRSGGQIIDAFVAGVAG